MKNKVQYEWTVEGIDSDDDIIESQFFPTFSEATDMAKDFVGQYAKVDIGLVRDEISEDGDIKQRHWAYIVNCQLPETMKDAGGSETNTPKKYIQEVEKFYKEW